MKPIMSQAELQRQAAAAAARPRLLAIDDQPINIQALYQAFSADHQVFMATGGEQGLALARDKLPDLVLLDVVMPGIDGYEVCRQLKADAVTRDIPVTFVTAHNDTQAETRGLEVGAVDFISKPINPPVVRARVRTHLTLKQQADRLRALAFVDGLTGVCNRRHFDQQLDAEVRRAARTARPLALAMVDVDFFKKFNDRYGHQAGDDCLRQVANALQMELKRPGDMLARYGGEEFACILPEIEMPAAADFAQRLVACVQSMGVAHEASDAGALVSISLGMAVRPADGRCDPIQLLALADAQLYRAKREGRARACVATVDAAVAPS